jgi:hypothetical protein
MMKSEKQRKVSGELDEATQELRNYIKLAGVIDIQKFRNEVKQRQMQARIPKEIVVQHGGISPLRSSK